MNDISKTEHCFFHTGPVSNTDPVYKIDSPGRFLDLADTWGTLIQPVGNTAIWPNYPVQLPKRVILFQF